MEFPTEVRKRIELLDRYTFDNSIASFDNIHIYCDGLAYPNGFYEARWINIIGYDESKGVKKDLGRHDGIKFEDGVVITKLVCYADKSIYIEFKKPVVVSSPFQMIYFGLSKESEEE